MELSKSNPEPTAPYQKMYVTLFKAVTAALYMMEDNELMKARALLIQAQRDTEELYIDANESAREHLPPCFFRQPMVYMIAIPPRR